MSSGGRLAGGLSERYRGARPNAEAPVAQAQGFTRRTPISLSRGLNELTDGTVCSVDAATGAPSVHIGNPG
jgi:hypothetical protein